MATNYQYAPPSFGPSSRGGGSLADLILRGGDQQAQAHMARGQIWADTARGLGETIGGAIQAHGQQKEVAKRDAAWLGFIESGEWQDPKKAALGTLKIWGPGPEGREQLAALGGVMQLGQRQRNPEADQKAATAIGTGMARMTPEGRARAYPQAYSLLQSTLPELAKQLPPTYDEKVWQETLAPLFAGGGDAPKTREIKVRNADGSESIQIVKDEPGQTFNSAADPGAGKLVTTLGADGRTPVQRMATPQELAGPGVPLYEKPASASDNEPLVAALDDNGQPRLMPRSQAAGRRPASNREQGRPVTSGDAGAIADFDTSMDDLAVLKSTLEKNSATGFSAAAGAAAPNIVSEVTGFGVEAKKRQATIDRVKQVIGKTLEGGVLRKEDELKYSKILPTIQDPPQVVTAKLAGLSKAIEQRRERFLSSLEDASYDVSQYRARTARDNSAAGAGPVRVSSPEEAKRLPRGTEFQTPDGRVMRVP